MCNLGVENDDCTCELGNTDGDDGSFAWSAWGYNSVAHPFSGSQLGERGKGGKQACSTARKERARCGGRRGEEETLSGDLVG
ncbi:hypothetical protein GALMADRAFT_1034695 [Galerina marginata CBS 339.88]|uniref:Uncharacterized protein n=1 Tax=Galerina marginata (strain CBS 339.88) TaxID=685588 RepID=A0A067SC91_GALM3|nr:hypothetical protein GALMADRAFT_1034695 [Galerina marginata CBS 339.88]